jgi:prephenate dehydrogenase
MTGDHRSGWDASRTGLFRGAPVFLCPTHESHTDAVNAATAVWRSLGARPECLSARRHDEKLAWTSHLPHMVSASLALALANAGVDRTVLGPGGRDTTRLAGSSPEMWTAIAMENASAIAEALKQAEQEMADLRASLERADEDELRARFENARAWFEREAESATREVGA